MQCVFVQFDFGQPPAARKAGCRMPGSASRSQSTETTPGARTSAPAKGRRTAAPRVVVTAIVFLAIAGGWFWWFQRAEVLDRRRGAALPGRSARRARGGWQPPRPLVRDQHGGPGVRAGGLAGRDGTVLRPRQGDAQRGHLRELPARTARWTPPEPVEGGQQRLRRPRPAHHGRQPVPPVLLQPPRRHRRVRHLGRAAPPTAAGGGRRSTSGRRSTASSTSTAPPRRRTASGCSSRPTARPRPTSRRRRGGRRSGSPRAWTSTSGWPTWTSRRRRSTPRNRSPPATQPTTGPAVASARRRHFGIRKPPRPRPPPRPPAATAEVDCTGDLPTARPAVPRPARLQPRVRSPRRQHAVHRRGELPLPRGRLPLLRLQPARRLRQVRPVPLPDHERQVRRGREPRARRSTRPITRPTRSSRCRAFACISVPTAPPGAGGTMATT